MTSGIALWVPIASMVTRAPSSASRSSSSGMAAISFDLPPTASCPSTRRCGLAQALDPAREAALEQLGVERGQHRAQRVPPRAPARVPFGDRIDGLLATD